MFGKGYPLIGVAALVLLPWYFARAAITHWEFAHLHQIEAHMWTALAWGALMLFAVKLFTAIAVVFVALGARQILRDLRLDMRADLAVIRAQWRSLVAVVVLWLIAAELVKLILYQPLISLLTHAPELYANAIGVVDSLLLLGGAWSILAVAFDHRQALLAFVAGVVGPWRLGMRSALVALLFVAAHFAQRWVSTNLGFALAHAAIANLSIAMRGFVEAVFVTFLTILLTVVYLER